MSEDRSEKDLADKAGGARRTLILRVTASLIAGAGAAVAAIGLVPGTQADLGGAAVSADAGPGSGRTTVRVPPFGSVSAETHGVPLQFTLSLDQLDPQLFNQALSGEAGKAELLTAMEKGLRETARRLAVRLVVAATLIGALAAALLPGRRPLGIGVGAAGGALVVGSLLALTARTFDVRAFQQPRFTGALSRAPQLIESVQAGVGDLKEVRPRLRTAAKRISQILALADTPLTDPHQGTVALLHISDIHSNPVGLEVAKQLAESFKVDAVVDSGDVTSFGEPIESRVAGLISSLPVPYLFVPGNHDSAENRAAIAQSPNAKLLDGNIENVAGLKIMGSADPSFTAKNQTSAAEGNELNRRKAAEVAAGVEELSPDVLVVHNPLLAAKSLGKTPLVLAGHKHRKAGRISKGTQVLEVGSTGATGLGTFLVQTDHDYEAEILYFRSNRLVTVDYVRFRALGADFDIERRTFPMAEEEAISAPNSYRSPRHCPWCQSLEAQQ